MAMTTYQRHLLERAEALCWRADALRAASATVLSQRRAPSASVLPPTAWRAVERHIEAGLAATERLHDRTTPGWEQSLAEARRSLNAAIAVLTEYVMADAASAWAGYADGPERLPL